MKHALGWWHPDHETHMIEWMTKQGDVWQGRHAYQGKKIRRVLELCPTDRRRCAVDIGAHVGLWSYYIAQHFEWVSAFEPIVEHQLCFIKNMEGDKYVLHPFALGDVNTRVEFTTTEGSSGDTYVSDDGNVEVRRLDSFGLARVDLIKADCQGYEYFALRGGEDTIKECKPVIVVEQKPGVAQRYGLAETQAVEYLKSLGMRQADERGGDYFMVW